MGEDDLRWRCTGSLCPVNFLILLFKRLIILAIPPDFEVPLLDDLDDGLGEKP